jgi:hypothetical protein
VREQELTVGNGVPVAGGWLAVGEAAEVVMRDEKARSVSQRENGDGDHLAQGSRKRGYPRRHYGDAAVLWCS